MATIARKYTGVNFDQVLSDMTTILRYKEGPLADLTQNSYGRTLLELFSGNADLIAAWAEAGFQESFLETSQQLSSAYLGSRMIGYSVRRPVPARAGYGIQLKRTGVYPTVRVLVPRNTVFTYNGASLLSIDDCQWAYDRTQIDFENGLMKLVSGRAVTLQGQIKTATYFSNGNKNQSYNIPDVTFSNWFGEQDPNWQDPATQNQISKMYTVINTDASLVQYNIPADTVGDKIYWRISRRGLFNPSQPKIFKDNVGLIEPEGVSNNYTVLVDTSNDGQPRLIFGDGVVSAIPFGAVNIKYISTLGALGNQTNVAGQLLNAGFNNILITQSDGTPSDLTIEDLNIGLTTDITGGVTLENQESIKNNASSIFSSLDSLGNRASYILYLRTYGNFKYANAYGEDFLSRYSKDNRVKLKYSNIIRFTVLKDLYSLQNGKVYPADPSQYYISGYKVNGLAYLWQYDYFLLPDVSNAVACGVSVDRLKIDMEIDNITIYKDGIQITTDQFITGYIAPNGTPNTLDMLNIFNANLQPKDFAIVGSELEILLNDISRRGYLTLGGGQTGYAPPIVQDMAMDINLFLFPGANFNDIRNLIKDDIYAYLKEHTDFAVPLYRSQIESLIQSQPEVAGVTVYFKARPNGFEEFNIANLLWMGSSTAVLVDQTGLNFNGMDIILNFKSTTFNVNGGKITTRKTLSFKIPDQAKLQQQILKYYSTNLSTSIDGILILRDNITEAELSGFCAFIWASMFNNILVPIYNDVYLPEYNAGNSDANSTWNAMDALRGWYFDEGILLFKPTLTVTEMFETTPNTLFNYFVYTLEYIKLIRNIIGPVVATALIEKTSDCSSNDSIRKGNITLYTEGTEIVQFVIANEDIKIKTITNAAIYTPSTILSNKTTQLGA